MLSYISSTFLLFHQLLTFVVAGPALPPLSASNAGLDLLQPNLEVNVTIPGALTPG